MGCIPRRQILLVNYFVFVVEFGHRSFQLATEDITVHLSIHIFIKKSCFCWSLGRNASAYAQFSLSTCIHLFNTIWMEPLFVGWPYFHLILSFKHIKRRLVRENHVSPIIHTEISILLRPGHSLFTMFCIEPLFLQFYFVFVTQFLPIIEDCS